MPTITVADLQKLIESASYEHYARSRSKGLPRPQSGNPYRRSRSRSHSRTRSYNRPSSAPRKCSTPEKENDEFVTSKKTRPQSAKPASSTYKGSDLDFTGLTNMMQGMKFTQYKKWRSKSNSTSTLNTWDSKSNGELSDRQKNNEHQKFKNLEKENLTRNRQVDPNTLRKSRSSSFSKFRYPVPPHSQRNARARYVMEQSIPSCLRRFPRYINQPVRHNCTYSPPVRSVTSVKAHTIKSKSLPMPINFVSAKPPIPPRSKSPVMIDSQTVDENVTDAEEHERNGTYHYVYNGPPSNFNTVVEVEVDSPENTARISQIIPNTDIENEVTPEEPVEIVDETIQSKNDIIKDFEDEATDDCYSSDGDHVNKNVVPDEDEKLSYGDMNDLQSLDDILEDIVKTPEKPSKVTNWKTESSSLSSLEDEIEEDIPEAIEMKPVAFNTGRGITRQSVKT